VVVELLAVASDAVEANLFDRALSGDTFSEAEAVASDERQAAVGIGQLVVWIGCAVFFIRWLHRAYVNAGPLGGYRRYDTGWAIGAWFVPFLNLVRPLRIVNDVWRASTRGADPHPIVIWWWITFLADTLFARIATQRGDQDTLAELRSGSIQLLASDAFTLIPAVLAILVLRLHTRAMDARAAEIGASSAAPPAPSFPGSVPPPGAEPPPATS
jgi:hypothetical protein